MMRTTLAAIAALLLTAPVHAGAAAYAGDAPWVAGLGENWWESGHACLHCRLELTHPTRADAMRGFDPDTGRDLRNYPPHPFADYHHMRLDIDIPDMLRPRFNATQTLTLSPIGADLPRLSLNAALLEIHSVSAEGHATRFEHDGKALTVTFDPPVPAGQRIDLVTDYTVNDPPEGIYWSFPSDAAPNLAPQLHSQGQPESNRYWFPTHDSPNVRMTTELVVTVPDGYETISNGALISSTTSRGRATHHWRIDRPHVPYLVTLVVGKFDTVDVAPRNARVRMPVHVPPGTSRHVRRTYERTHDMLRLFESLTGQPYPWDDRYAHVVVRNFIAGGMENTTATTMYDTAVLDSTALLDGDLDGLISHELAHQWFGNLITCRSWLHIWLNEGFATYFTHLWFEHRDGADAYLAGVRSSFDSVIARDRANAPDQPAMASRRYDHPWDVFRREANPYPKGASILHMLRKKLGDEIFFNGVARYTRLHADTSAETDDLRKALEEASGLSLERFFDQWVYRPGIPRLDISYNWDDQTSSLTVNLTQTQNIDPFNPAFDIRLPIWIRTNRGTTHTLLITTDQRTSSAAVKLDSPPLAIAADPHLALLAQLDIDQPLERWLALLEHAPTLPATLQAARAIADLDPDDVPSDARTKLATLAANRNAHHTARAAALSALASLDDSDHLMVLGASVRDDARARRAWIQAIAQLARARKDTPTYPHLADILTRTLESDPSYAVRAEAARALGRLAHTDALPLILAAAETDSQHDQIRQAALDALASLDHPDGLPVAIRHTRYGVLPRTRPAAVRALAALSHHDPEPSLDLLISLLDDREVRTIRAAGEALLNHDDPRAHQAIRDFAAAARGSMLRATARAWLDQLNSPAD